MARRVELAQLVGAALARPRRQIPKSEARGLPGCRAPAGRFAVTVSAWPPGKSNQYTRVSYRAPDPVSGALVERRGLASSVAVRAFELELALAVERAYAHLDYLVEWYSVPPSRIPRPRNPLFGHDVEVDLEIILREPLRTNRDTGNVEKVVGDVLTSCAVWWDDVQVRNFRVRRISGAPGIAGEESASVIVTSTGEPASWSSLRGGWPLSTAAVARELRLRREAASVAVPAAAARGGAA